jgi:tripartite-type tricarboxylate transporter receptor subunit TctC
VRLLHNKSQQGDNGGQYSPEETVNRWLVRTLATLSIASAPICSLARADYPDRTIKVICAYAAGGGGDLMVRWYANALKDLAGKPVVVENKVGANGHVGDQAAMDARPDGYTMIITGASAYVGNPLLMKDIDYHPMVALAPITTLNELGLILVVNPKLPIHSVADLTAFIKSKNGKALYGVQTSSALVAANLYLQKIGAEATRVNYKSAADAASDIVAGLIDFYFPDATLAMAQAAQGRVRMLASTPAKRVSVAPELPTLQEAGVPDFDYSVVWGAWFPRTTPEPIIGRMHDWLVEIVERPATRKFLFEAGAEPRPSGSPAAMGEVIKGEYEKWRRIVQAAKIEKE